MQTITSNQLQLLLLGPSGKLNFATVQLVRNDHCKLVLRLIAGNPALLNRHGSEGTSGEFQLQFWGDTRRDILWESTSFQASFDAPNDNGELELRLLEKVDLSQLLD